MIIKIEFLENLSSKEALTAYINPHYIEMVLPSEDPNVVKMFMRCGSFFYLKQDEWSKIHWLTSG